MKHYITIVFVALSFLLGCKKDDDNSANIDCNSIDGQAHIVFDYYNAVVPQFSLSSATGNVEYERLQARKILDNVELTVSGIQVINGVDKFKIDEFDFEENLESVECYKDNTHNASANNIVNSELSTVLVIDMSNSLIRSISDIKQYTKSFIEKIYSGNSNSKVSVILFSDRNHIVETPFYNYDSRYLLYNKIDEYSTYQQTSALYEAVNKATDKLNRLGSLSRKSMFVFTDGIDDGSNNPSQLINNIKLVRGVQKYMIGVQANTNPFTEIKEQNDFVFMMNNLSEAEKYFSKSSDYLTSIYDLYVYVSNREFNQEDKINYRVQFKLSSIE